MRRHLRSTVQLREIELRQNVRLRGRKNSHASHALSSAPGRKLPVWEACRRQSPNPSTMSPAICFVLSHGITAPCGVFHSSDIG